jgi:uncharacterized protein (DUF488 family)
LAPTKDLLRSYQKGFISWADYEVAYLELLERRLPEIKNEVKIWGREPLLICSEHQPEKCHRKLAAEFLLGKGLVEKIEHLVS